MKINIQTGVSDVGHLKTLMGVNFQSPSIEDKLGNTLQNSSEAGKFFALCMDYIRQPNGSETYYIQDRNDENVQAFYNDILPNLPNDVKHDITWPLQVPARDIRNWDHDRLNRIAFFNEMPMHTGNGKEFDTVEIAEDQLDILELQIEALNAAKNMDIDHAEAILRVEVGSKVSKMSSKELKRDLLLFASKNPALFINLANDENVQLRNFAVRASEARIIELSGDQRYFTWASNGRKLMEVPFDENPFSAFAAYLKTDEGVEVYKSIDKKLG